MWRARYALFVRGGDASPLDCRWLNTQHIYPHTTSSETYVATSAVMGSVCGQIAFGMLADRIGRKRGFIATLLLVLTGALLSSAAVESPNLSIFVLIAIFRFVLGVGIGGECVAAALLYPAAATNVR